MNANQVPSKRLPRKVIGISLAKHDFQKDALWDMVEAEARDYQRELTRRSDAEKALVKVSAECVALQRRLDLIAAKALSFANAFSDGEDWSGKRFNYIRRLAEEGSK